jgi:hypothetical protein
MNGYGFTSALAPQLDAYLTVRMEGGSRSGCSDPLPD